jgi:hypothetical protein
MKALAGCYVRSLSGMPPPGPPQSDIILARRPYGE